MPDKQLTPIHEAIKYLQSIEKAGVQLAFKQGIKVSIEKLQALLPTEKEFAKDAWDTGVNFSLEQMDSAVKRHKEPDFNTFYKQYVP